MLSFEATELYDLLVQQTAEERDALPFGVIELDAELVCQAYNQTESRFSGLSPERVIGRQFFELVAPCMNNFMVRDRLLEEELDVIIDYVLSVRITPTPVRLRMLVKQGSSTRFLVVETPEER